ncbi:DUF2314 domain-containing protein [Yoonia sp. GPGPB17]|uniref:DUF2314 domain-containing protein n=1 Tax=Yoonia sp. GPGPB17 TaxID=3026147 RepID=UPI0030BB3D98
MSKFIHITLIAFLTFSAPIWAQGDPTFNFATDDASMNAAMAEARDTLDVFLENTLSDGQSAPQTMLKVSIPTANGNEIIWVSPFAQTSATEWIGILANQPQDIKGANAGDTVTFDTTQIADWALFSEDGVMYGGYTIREMVASGAVTPDMVPAMSDNPIPETW